MKKYILFAVIAVLALSIAGGVVLAQPVDPVNGLPTEGVPTSGADVLAIINTIGNWIFAIFLSISIIYIVMAAFKFVTGGPEGVSDARQKLIFAVIGIAIALLATGFDDILRSILGLSSS